MPLELVKVERVESERPPFTVYGTTVEDTPKYVKVHTWDSLKASACRRGMETNRCVWMTWRDRHFGECQLITVSLDDTKWSHDDQPAA